MRSATVSTRTGVPEAVQVAGEKDERLYEPPTRRGKGGHPLNRGRGRLRVRMRWVGRFDVIAVAAWRVLRLGQLCVHKPGTSRGLTQPEGLLPRELSRTMDHVHM